MQLIGYPVLHSPLPQLFEMARINSLKYLNTKLFSLFLAFLDILVQQSHVDTSYMCFEILKL